MKTLALSAMILLAGCVNTPAGEFDATSAPPLPTPFGAEGRLYLPPSEGEARKETLILFPVNATGMAIVIDAVLGSNYGPAEVPPLVVDVIIELRAPDQSALAQEEMRADATTAHIKVVANQTGEHTLAILSYGGSDGSANGDRVDWRIDVS